VTPRAADRHRPIPVRLSLVQPTVALDTSLRMEDGARWLAVAVAGVVGHAGHPPAADIDRSLYPANTTSEAVTDTGFSS